MYCVEIGFAMYIVFCEGWICCVSLHYILCLSLGLLCIVYCMQIGSSYVSLHYIIYRLDLPMYHYTILYADWIFLCIITLYFVFEFGSSMYRCILYCVMIGSTVYHYTVLGGDWVSCILEMKTILCMFMSKCHQA